jgi:hypothetical protein
MFGLVDMVADFCSDTESSAGVQLATRQNRNLYSFTECGAYVRIIQYLRCPGSDWILTRILLQ